MLSLSVTVRQMVYGIWAFIKLLNQKVNGPNVRTTMEKRMARHMNERMEKFVFFLPPKRSVNHMPLKFIFPFSFCFLFFFFAD